MFISGIKVNLGGDKITIIPGNLIEMIQKDPPKLHMPLLSSHIMLPPGSVSNLPPSEKKEQVHTFVHCVYLLVDCYYNEYHNFYFKVLSQMSEQLSIH